MGTTTSKVGNPDGTNTETTSLGPLSLKVTRQPTAKYQLYEEEIVIEKQKEDC